MDLSQDDLVDDGRVGGVVQVMTCIRMIVDAHRQGGDDLHQDDDADKVVLVRTTMWWMTAPRMTWWTTAAWVALCRDLKQPKAYGNLAVNRTFETAR